MARWRQTIGNLGSLEAGMVARCYSILLMALTVLASAPSSRAQQAPPEASREAETEWASGQNVAAPQGLPDIGKWMLTRRGAAADWLGQIYEGKNLREPINVLIVDEAATSVEDAKARLLAAAAQAGYPIRFGHSAGYQGYIGGRLYEQLPQGRDDAFSNDIFEVNNNHGRIFGPHQAGQAYVFTGAFSREEVDPFRSPGHRYASFNRARDDFTQNLHHRTRYKVSGFVNLDSALVADPKVTTGDHDGIAVLLRAVE
jgi:hypothetical protein